MLRLNFPGKNTRHHGRLNHVMIVMSINQPLRHNLGYEKYKLFDVTKFILVLPTFRLLQQSLS